jgi:HPt (histidine-containing phosphotransfer) domain-containing protein
MPITNPDYSNINHEEMAAAIGLKAKHVPLLVGSFLDEATPILENLKNAIDSKNYADIKSFAHSIKGSAGNLRFNEIYEMSKELEYAGAQADAEFDFDGYFDAIKTAISTIKI